MQRRYRVGEIIVGVVHGDAESLAGWRFDVSALDDGQNQAWIAQSFRLAGVDVFASSHTCLPAMRCFQLDGKPWIVANNGAAGMPNFRGDRKGLITRISTIRFPGERLYGERIGEVHVDAIEVSYDHQLWCRQFEKLWPAGSSASISYLDRIMNGPHYSLAAAHPGGKHSGF
jgi:hypothetical protein